MRQSQSQGASRSNDGWIFVVSTSSDSDAEVGSKTSKLEQLTVNEL